MEAAPDRNTWQNGFEAALDEAISVVDSMRGPGLSNMASPILLRIRAELIALREAGPAVVKAA